MITIRTYSDRIAASNAKALLESEGLLVYLKNENFSAAMPMHTSSIGEIELQVENEEAERALEILGPDSGDAREVEKISRRLNRLFGIILLAAFAAGLGHAASQGFDTDKIGTSFTVGIGGGLLALLVMSVVNRGK